VSTITIAGERQPVEWRTLIENAYRCRDSQTSYRSRPEFCRAATLAELEDAERTLNITLPTALRSLYLETGGVMDMMSVEGGEWFLNLWTVWPVDELVSHNLRLRSEAIPSGLLSFATAGVDGIYICFTQTGDLPFGSGVSAWNSFEKRVFDLAPSFADFITGWLNGTVSV
jgi:hypothetical protein